MRRAERLQLLLFLGLFSGATGLLFTLLCCGSEYWLLAAESCGPPPDPHGEQVLQPDQTLRVFHEGLFWRCSFPAASRRYSLWDLWITNQPPSKLCQPAFLFPFPSDQLWAESRRLPTVPYEPSSAIVFRTFWSIFLVVGVASTVGGAFVVVCAGPLANHVLYKVGGALQLCGGLALLAVLLMFLLWIHVLDALERFALHQRASTCPSFHLAVHHGPSFLLAPVAVFFCLLAGLLSLLIGRSVREQQVERRRRKNSGASSTEL
ncbi:transmembrane protein 182-like [Salarias fasciatus]|uniref:transmembrane protein 182-like n=1 Tax=Salarias fasciatus TaxID=181472 RepID=UPI001176D455|nr:transmembrane protein 182-like [Salarias fasciatus]